MAIVQPWMDTIRDYLMLMTNKYGDRFELRYFDIEPGDSEFGQLYNTKVNYWWPARTVAEHCEGKQVVGEYVIDAPKHFSAPVRRQTVACFKVGDSEMIMDEMIYSSFHFKNTLAIFPNARVRRFRLDIKGSIGIHALVGYLKLMPALCKKMDELAARIDKMLEKQRCLHTATSTPLQ